MRFLKSITWFEWLIIGAALLLGFIALAPAEALGADITDFGAIPGGPDTTPAWNAAVAAALGNGDRTIRIPAGKYYFYSTPATLVGEINIIGEGLAATTLVRNYSGGTFITMLKEGVNIRGLSIHAGAGTSGGIGIWAISNNSQVGGNHVIEDVWITGQGTWTLPLFLDGSGRTLAPQGIRTVSMRNVRVFNATWWAVEWWCCVGCEWFGGGAYQGLGTTQAIVVGGVHSTGNRIDAQIDWAASTVWPGSMR